MQNVGSILEVSAVSLLLGQAAIVLSRVPRCRRRAGPLLLAASLVLLALLAWTPRGTISRDLLLLSLLWAGGAFLVLIACPRRLAAWTGASIVLAAVLLFSSLLGSRDSIPFIALRAFGVLLLATGPMGLVAKLWIRSRSIAALLTFLACALWAMTAGAIIVRGGFPFPLLDALESLARLFLALCTGWLVFQEGYPARPGWRGSLGPHGEDQELPRSIASRLLASENAMAAQERLVASGFLALGAAHEFKNILALVKAAAQHGLGQPCPAIKDASIRLILDHAVVGRDSAVEVLQRLAADGREKPCRIDTARDLAGLVQTARAALRGEGILIEADFSSGVGLHARRLDVEQILLNLIENAAEGCRRLGRDGTSTIVLRARLAGDVAVLEVQDAAGGVPQEQRHRLFQPSFSGTGSTGLGLYLSRSLAQANGGSLDYQPAEGGSVFRLSLPAEGEEGSLGEDLVQ